MLIFIVTRQLTSLHRWQHNAEIQQKTEFPDCCGIASLLYDSSTRFSVHFPGSTRVYCYRDRLHGSVLGNIRRPSWSRVSTTCIFDRHLKLVDTCHVMGTVHLCTSPPPTQLSVVVIQIKLITNVCISSRDLFLLSHDSLMPSKQMTFVDNQYHSVHRVAHIHESWERDDDDQANILQVCRNTNVCQINRSWERYGNYWLGSL
jgi:hypothetical protein